MTTPQSDRQHFVYWLFDATGCCLYVGMTRVPEKRWKGHQRSNRAMAARVAYKRMAGPFGVYAARELEREQQEDLEPIYDAHINRRREQELWAATRFGAPVPRPRWEGLFNEALFDVVPKKQRGRRSPSYSVSVVPADDAADDNGKVA